jgi:stage II sporulation SpoAA-like protein
MIDLKRHRDGNQNLLVVQISGRLSEREYRVGIPQIESDLDSLKNLLLLFDLQELEGWDSGTRWKSLKFSSSRDSNDIRRVGVVGRHKWKRWIRGACRPLKSPIRNFESFNDAMEWLLQESIPDCKTWEK